MLVAASRITTCSRIWCLISALRSREFSHRKIRKGREIMADPFVAEIRIFPFNFAPKGWAFCDGQLLPLSQNTPLFSLLGPARELCRGHGGRRSWSGCSLYSRCAYRESRPIFPGSHWRWFAAQQYAALLDLEFLHCATGRFPGATMMRDMYTQ